MVSVAAESISSMVGCGVITILFIVFIVDVFNNFYGIINCSSRSVSDTANLSVHVDDSKISHNASVHSPSVYDNNVQSETSKTATTKTNMYTSKKPKTPNPAVSIEKWIQYLAITCILSYFTSSILNYIAGIDALITLTESKKIAAFANAFQILGKVSMQIGFVRRLQYSFKDSIYAYRKCLISLLYILSAIELPLGLGIAYAYFINDEDMTYTTAAIFLTFDFYLSLFTLLLFVRKLFQLMHKRVTFTQQKKNNNKQTADYVISVDYIEALIKFTILVLIAFLSDLTTTTLAAIFNYNELENQFILNCFIINTDELVNSLCIYMTFSSLSGGLYYHYLCPICYRCFQKCCICCISWKLKGELNMEHIKQILLEKSKENSKTKSVSKHDHP